MAVHFPCSCGENLSADESQAGQQIPCPRCARVVTVPAAAAAPVGDSLSYVSPSGGSAVVTPRAVDMLQQTVRWVRIVAVFIFIACAFMLLAGGCVFLGGIASLSAGKGAEPIALACVYVVLAPLYLMPGIFLWRYGSHSKEFVYFQKEQALELALEAQKSFWKYIAILMIVILCVEIVALIAGLALGVLAAVLRHP